MKIFRQRHLLLFVSISIVTVMIAGCAANGRGMAQGDEECSAARTAGAGALIGAALGAVIDGREGAVKGAAAGAVIGGLGCMAMNYHTKQVRSAQQVNKQYVEQHQQLPAQPTVTNYALSAPKEAVRGKPVSVNSSITVVDGRNQSVDRVQEKLFIVNSNGDRKQIKTKEAQEGMNGGGEYSNTFSFTPPTGVAEGNYHLESEVYVNDKLAKTAKTPLVLATMAHPAEQVVFVNTTDY